MCFYFLRFSFFSWYSYKNYEFRNRIKILCKNSGIIIKYKLIIKKQNKKHNKIALLAKSKLNSIEVLTSNVFIGSNISHDEFILINNVVEEFYGMMEKIKNSNDE